jgi:PIN domain nuclease of toxin-antitoxin system
LRLIADGHALIWHVLDDPRLTAAPTARLEADDAEVLMSIASTARSAAAPGST